MRWAAWNATLAALLYLGVFQDVQWAANLMLAAIWFAFAVGLAAYIIAGHPAKEVQAELARMRASGYPVPKWLDVSFDAGMAIALAAAGWFWTLGGLVVGSMLIHAVYGARPTPDR